MTPREIVMLAVAQKIIPYEYSSEVEQLIRQGINNFRSQIRVNINRIIELVDCDEE